MRLALERGLKLENPEELIAEREIEDLMRLLPVFARISRQVMQQEGANALMQAVDEFLASQVPAQVPLGAEGFMPSDRSRRTDAGMDVAQMQGRTGGAAQGQEVGGERRQPIRERNLAV